MPNFWIFFFTPIVLLSLYAILSRVVHHRGLPLVIGISAGLVGLSTAFLAGFLLIVHLLAGYIDPEVTKAVWQFYGSSPFSIFWWGTALGTIIWATRRAYLMDYGVKQAFEHSWAPLCLNLLFAALGTGLFHLAISVSQTLTFPQ